MEFDIIKNGIVENSTAFVWVLGRLNRCEVGI